tara:strand:+ start:44 stop:436 length:393 start_codon:yes stop_codon:yes gene_type:complete
MSRIYNKHIDQVIRSVGPTLGRKKTEEYLKKAQSTGVVDKNVSSKKLKKIISDIKVENKAEGGRIGYKRGTGLMPKKKSNVDKIKKTFGPKSLGMQSVIYGLDKNKNVTKADPKAKFIAAAKNKKKKVIA